RELGRKLFPGATHRLAFGRLLGRVAELDHEIVLRTIDAESVPVMLAGEGADVVDVRGREVRCQLDHHAPGRNLHVQQVGRIGRAPVRRLRCVEQFLGRLRLRGLVRGNGGNGNAAGKQGEDEQAMARHGGLLGRRPPILARGDYWHIHYIEVRYSFVDNRQETPWPPPPPRSRRCCASSRKSSAPGPSPWPCSACSRRRRSRCTATRSPSAWNRSAKACSRA